MQEIVNNRFELWEMSKRVIAHVTLSCPVRSATNCDGRVELSELTMGNFPFFGWEPYTAYDSLFDRRDNQHGLRPRGRCSGCGISVELLPEVANTLIPGATRFAEEHILSTKQRA